MTALYLFPGSRVRLAFLLLILAAALTAQTQPVFRSGLDLVHVDAGATDRNGRVLSDLNARDFLVFDNDKPVEIDRLLRFQQPLDLILLFDVSRSMRETVQRVAGAAQAALRELRPGDRVCVRTFNTSSQVVLAFSGDMDRVQSAVREVAAMRFDGGTFIQKAVDEAAQSFPSNAAGERRRAVLIITDNMGVRTHREETVVEDLWRADATLSGLIVADPHARTARTIATVLSPPVILIEAGMKGIAEKTGGDVLEGSNAAKGLPEAIERIRSRYSIYYQMPQNAKSRQHRTIRVQLSPDELKRSPNARVKARRGYVVPDPTGGF